ncbi:MAG: NAD-dependent epimerase/dehydratase family protein [Deltaproteobacteria bacterium]|nr:NAD-dependent epimerase/dehydratase family protein [Deltaproteobacteria bacterium]
MRAFVTGATGFLGSHLVDRLLGQGDEVHALARRTSNLRWLQGKKVQIHYGDVLGDLHGIEEGLKGVDLCFHVAGIIRAPRREIYFQINAEGTRNLFETILKVNPKIKKIVVVTSLAAHGPSRDGRPMNEEDPCRPITDYGESKWEEERVALQYKDRLPITMIRPPAIYGPRDEQILKYFQMVKRRVVIIPGRSPQRLNMAHAQDVVTGMLLAAESSRSTGETFFIGDSRDYEWGEVADLVGRTFGKRLFRIRIPISLLYLIGCFGEIVTRLTGRSVPFGMTNMKNFAQKNWTLDISKARKILGYEPAYSLEKGIAETANWYRENGWV